MVSAASGSRWPRLSGQGFSGCQVQIQEAPGSWMLSPTLPTLLQSWGKKNPDLSKTKGPPNSNQVLEQMKKLEPITPEVMTWGVTCLIRGKAWTPGAAPHKFRGERKQAYRGEWGDLASRNHCG